AIYLCSTLISYGQYRYRLNEKYGKLTSTMTTTFFYKESLIINSAIVIVVCIATIPVAGLSGVEYIVSSFTDSMYAYPIFRLGASYATVYTQFRDKPFKIQLKNGEIVKDTFENYIYENYTFKQLYSNWMKKQIGCDDDNVEFSYYPSYVPIDSYINTETLMVPADDFSVLFDNYKECDINGIYVNDEKYVYNGDEKTLYQQGKKAKELYIEIKKYKEKMNINKNEKWLPIDVIRFNDDISKSYNKYNIKFAKSTDLIEINAHISRENEKEYEFKIINEKEKIPEVLENMIELKKIADATVPKYFINAKIKHFLVNDEVERTDEIIETPNDKYYQDSRIRYDLSDINSKKYVVDILYYNCIDKKYYNDDGERLDPYKEKDFEQMNSLISTSLVKRYFIKIVDDKLQVVNEIEIKSENYDEVIESILLWRDDNVKK
ncbi:MAG: hypothetical protein Q4G04_06930, partial [bacterium]|nr:hypothetical protein [bacterium]